MKRSRLNDTAAISSRSAGSGVDHTISSRKIDNGFIIRESSYNEQTGKYTSSEQFSKDAPRITPGRVDVGASPDGAGNTLAATKRYLGGDV
jgi:hypothetical protein